MEVGNYKFDYRAFTAFNQLATKEQAQVLETLATLADTPVAQWPATQAKRLPGNQHLYLVRVNDSLRVIVGLPDGQKPEVMDIVRRETLESFSKAAADSLR
jgi:hypothetical protein